jgi:hypothetical protein
MALLTVDTISRVGLDVQGALQAADVLGDTWANTGTEFVIVQAGPYGPVVVTLDITRTVDGQPVTDRTVNIPTGDMMAIGPFSTADYGTLAKVTYDDESDVSIGLFKVGT